MCPRNLRQPSRGSSQVAWVPGRPLGSIVRSPRGLAGRRTVHGPPILQFLYRGFGHIISSSELDRCKSLLCVRYDFPNPVRRDVRLYFTL